MRTAPIVMMAVAALVASCKKEKAKDAPRPPAAAVAVDAAAAAPGGTVPAPPPAPASGRTLKMNERPHQVGDKRTKVDDVEVKFQIDAEGRMLEASSSQHEEETVKILEVKDDVVMKVEVTYGTLTSKRSTGPKVEDKPEIRSGKTYLVWSEGGAIKATLPDGSAVTAEELAELASENDEVGKPDAMSQILGGRTWTIGETYQFTADDLAKLAARNAASKPKATAFALTLQSFDDKEAHFALTTTMVQKQGADQLTFDMTGHVRIELPVARPTELMMTGTLTGTIRGMKTGGSMAGTTRYSY